MKCRQLSFTVNSYTKCSHMGPNASLLSNQCIALPMSALRYPCLQVLIREFTGFSIVGHYGGALQKQFCKFIDSGRPGEMHIHCYSTIATAHMQSRWCNYNSNAAQVVNMPSVRGLQIGPEHRIGTISIMSCITVEIVEVDCCRRLCSACSIP